MQTNMKAHQEYADPAYPSVEEYDMNNKGTVDHFRAKSS